MATISIVDMGLSGGRREWSVDTRDERVPLREIIRWRVREEVAERRLALMKHMPQPTAEERALNGERPRRAQAIDWEDEYARALDAFTAHRFIALVEDRQIDDLDTLITLRSGCEVIFLRLTPLVGG